MSVFSALHGWMALALLAVTVGCGCSRDTPRAGWAAGNVPAAVPSELARAPAATEPLARVTAPALAPNAARPASSLRVLVGGDLLPHRPSLAAPEAIRAALAPLRPLFGAADATVANFEAATGVTDAKTARMAYAVSPSWLAELPRSGIVAVTVANNHACDLGEKGLAATLQATNDGHLLALGADDDDPWAPQVLAERDGKRVCAVAWTTLMNARGVCARSNRLAFASPDAQGKRRVARAMARARTECDATVAIFHGGDEYAEQTTEIMGLARRAAESGADAVVIHHPHVPSPIVVHPTADGRRVPIFASVGNLVSNQGESYKDSMFPVLADNRRMVCVNAWTRLGVLADLAFDFAGGTPSLAWGYHLLWTENSHAEDRSVKTPTIETRLLDPALDRKLLARLAQDRRGPLPLLSDACWVEGPGREGSSSPRCRTTLGQKEGELAAEPSEEAGRHSARRRAVPKPPLRSRAKGLGRS